jgi:hypothetical protein
VSSTVLTPSSMPRIVFFNLDQEPLGHARRGLLIILIAPRARRAGCAVGTGARPIPRLAGMGLTDPADVLAEGAFDHGRQFMAVNRHATTAPARGAEAVVRAAGKLHLLLVGGALTTFLRHVLFHAVVSHSVLLHFVIVHAGGALVH